MNSLMALEIKEEAQKLSECIQINQEKLNQIGDIVRQNNIRFVIYAARGSSDNAGVYFKYLCEIETGLPVAFAAPSVLTLYNGDLKMENTLVIGVSQSGKAKDVLSIVEHAKAQKALTISITNDDESPLALSADFHLGLNVGLEKSVAATKTFTAQMFLLAHIVASISNNQSLKNELDFIPTLINQTYLCEEVIHQLALNYQPIQDCFVLGRGYAYAIADEFALKMQETSYIKAMSFATSDFYHGPFALANKDANFFVLAPKDETIGNSQEIIEQIEALGAACLVFTNDDSLKAKTKIILPDAPARISSFALIVAIQMFSLHLSLAKGMNPDQPRGLKKVTITV